MWEASQSEAKQQAVIPAVGSWSYVEQNEKEIAAIKVRGWRRKIPNTRREWGCTAKLKA